MPNLKRLRPVPDEPTLIAYFCRECEKVVKAKSQGGKKKYTFKCPDCDNQCVYGTARSIIHFMRIKEHSENGKILLDMQKEKQQAVAAASQQQADQKNTTQDSK